VGGVLSSAPPNPRLEILRSFAEKRPQDPFPCYALAMELKSRGDAELAWAAFESLLADHSDYLASYAPAGEVLVGLDRLDEARALYRKGIEACARRSDSHTQSHLEDALAALEK
jgi:hypothetical protein